MFPAMSRAWMYTVFVPSPEEHPGPLVRLNGRVPVQSVVQLPAPLGLDEHVIFTGFASSPDPPESDAEYVRVTPGVLVYEEELESEPGVSPAWLPIRPVMEIEAEGGVDSL